MNELVLRARPLTASAFQPFGEVIETAGHAARPINEDTCLRYDDLARIDVAAQGGRPLLSVFVASPRPLPLRVRALERHPLSSQAFFPLESRRFLVVVAEDGAAPLSRRLHAFLSSGGQGVNYRRNTWHHPLIALDAPSHFVVVDRGGTGENCEETTVEDAVVLVTAE